MHRYSLAVTRAAGDVSSYPEGVAIANPLKASDVLGFAHFLVVMERRQRPAENGTRDRPSFANHPLPLQPRFSHEVPQHRGALPRVFYPDGGAVLTGRWETRSPHEVGRPGFLPQDGSEQRDGHLDFTQHGYHGHEPQQRGGPRGISQHGPLRPQLFPHGGTRPGIPHHGPMQPAIIRNDGSLPDTSQQRAPELLQGAIQYNATPQSLRAQTPEAAFQGRPHQMRPADRAETSAMSHQGSSRENVSDHRRESQDVAQRRNSHENIYYQSGERQSSIQDREGVNENIYYQSGERQSSIQDREGVHKNIYYQSGERQSSIQDREGVHNISSDAMYSEMPPPRSEHGAYQPDLFHHGGPSSSTGPNPAISPYSGMAKQCDSRSSGPLSGPQPAGFHHDFPHNRSNLQHTYLDEGAQRGMSCADSQAGIYNLNTPAVPETFSYRAPSPVLQQYSPQLQPAHTQNTPYINDPQQGHYHLPPLHGSLSNPSYALHSPVGPVFSGSHEEGDLEVSRLQRLGNHPHHLLSQQQSIIHQDRRPDLDPIMPTRMSGGRCFEVDSPFLHNEVPDGRGDPNLLLHHGSPFFSQPTPTTHIEDHFMHLDRKSDIDKGGPADKEVFVQWLSSFLSCRRKKPPSKTDAVQAYSIADARGLIYGALRLVSQLDSLCQALEDSNKEGEPWTCDYKKAADVRVDLERRMKELEKPGYIQGVKRKLDGVRRKRLRWQRRRIAEEEEEKAATERSAEREAGIDLWRMQCIQKVEEKKRERELKATADSVLGEVRKKQNDVKKMLDVLKSLEKLRKLRKEAAGRKGVCPPPSADETFTNHIIRLRSMVHKRSALYDAEEKTLRVILEGEQEEERQREKDKRLKKEKEKTLQKQRELDSILFGDTEPLPGLHPLQPFRQFYLQAEHSVVSLVQIRHEWDQFLVPPDHPDGSSIPRGWLVPTLPSNDTWATALKQSD